MRRYAGLEVPYRSRDASALEQHINFRARPEATRAETAESETHAEASAPDPPIRTAIEKSNDLCRVQFS